MDIKEQLKYTNNGSRFAYIFCFYLFKVSKPYHSKNIMVDNSVKWDLNVKSKKNNKVILSKKKLYNDSKCLSYKKLGQALDIKSN